MIGWLGAAGSERWPLASGFGLAVVGDRVEQSGFAHAFAFVINDDAARRFASLEPDLDRAIGQMTRRLKAKRFKREGIIGAHLALFLDVEEFVVGFVRWEEAHAAAVQREPIHWRHTKDGMGLGVVVFLDPRDKLAVERLQR